MKDVLKAIILSLKVGRTSIAYFFRDHPKLKSLSLEQYGNTPLEKAAFTLHYFFIDNDNNNYDAPVEIVQGIVLYLNWKGFEFKNLESLYKDLSNAFNTKQSIKEIELILREHLT
jgi:hypothetical protein